ncbi:hypothetical protein KCU93_g1676, partial [Aureobasidium melanogenum]
MLSAGKSQTMAHTNHSFRSSHTSNTLQLRFGTSVTQRPVKRTAARQRESVKRLAIDPIHQSPNGSHEYNVEMADDFLSIHRTRDQDTKGSLPDTWQSAKDQLPQQAQLSSEAKPSEAEPSPERESSLQRKACNTSTTTRESPLSFYEPPIESEFKLASADMESESNYTMGTDSRPPMALIRPRRGQQQQLQKPSMTTVSTRARGTNQKRTPAVPSESEYTLANDMDEEETLANSMDEEEMLAEDTINDEHAASGLANNQASADKQPVTKAIRKTARTGRVDQLRDTVRPSKDLQTGYQRKFSPANLAVVSLTVVSEDNYGITIAAQLARAKKVNLP